MAHGGAGQNVKHPSVRSRRPLHPGSARTLHELTPEEIDIPPLPTVYDEEGNQILWHAMAVRWWDDMFSSPMAPEYHSVDIHGLYRMLRLEHDFWAARTVTLRLSLSAEIRLGQKDYGMTPYDRRRLQWQIQATEKAEDEGRRRRASAPKPTVVRPDPRFDELTG